MRDRTRREYLRTGLAGAATGGLTGCIQVPRNPLSGGGRTGTYLDWLPAPEPMGGDPYAVQLVRPGDVADHADALHPATMRVAERHWVPFSPVLREALGRPRDFVVGFHGVNVRRGVPDEDPTGTLRDLGYRRLEARGEFDVMEWSRLASDREWAPRIVAAGEDGVVTGYRAADRTDVEAVVDASRGAAPRFHEEAPRVETVGTAAGTRTFTHLDSDPRRRDPRPPDDGLDDLAGLVAVASGWNLSGDAADLRMVLEFEDDADAEVADVEGTVGGRWLEECREHSVSRDGATVTLSASIAVDRFDFQHAGDPGADGIPDAAFDLAQPLGEMEVTHAGEQPVPADELEVALYTGTRVESVPVQRRLTGRQFADRYDVVEPGDRMDFHPPHDGWFHVEWVNPQGDDRLVLGELWYDG